MTNSQKKALLAKINEEITKTKDEIKHLEEMVKPISPDVSLGRLTRMEAINEKSINDSLLIDLKKRLNKLDFVLRKADSESFGICDICEEEIDYERLMVIPESTICIECQKEM